MIQERYDQHKIIDYISKILRPLNFVGGIGTIAAAVLVLLVNGIGFTTLLNLFFTSLLGVLLLAGEWNLTVINENCKFLVTLLGRGFYDIFVGGWVFSLHILVYPDPNSILDEFTDLVTYVVYIVLWAIGGFFIVFHFVGRSKYIYDIQK